jgi:hypothetical protein
LYVAETEPPPAGTVKEPYFAVDRPVVETQTYRLSVPAPPAAIGSDHAKPWDDPTSQVKLIGRLL